MDQFNRLQDEYASFVESDPMRRGLHYPGIINKVFETSVLTHQRLLDIGCGDGLLDRILASDPYFAKVTGFDSAPDLISIAKTNEANTPLGIQFDVKRADEYQPSENYDNAFSVMVLPYAPDEAYLIHFFKAAYASLSNGGRFLSILFNPSFQAFGTTIGNRMFTKSDPASIQVHFLHPQTGKTVFTSHLTQFSQDQYEHAATQVGFSKIRWQQLHPSTNALQQWGTDFWKQCIDQQPYALLITEK